MRTHFCFNSSKERLLRVLPNLEIKEKLSHNFNLGPGAKIPVILPKASKLELKELFWGITPHWSKEIDLSGSLYKVNKDYATSKPSFRIPLRTKRCIIPMDSFFVWCNRKPYRVYRRDEQPILVAGVWESFIKDNKYWNSCAILTGNSNRELFPYEKNPPVELNMEQALNWVETGDLNSKLNLLVSQQSNTYIIHQVTDQIADTSFNSAEVLTKVNDGMTLFSQI